MQRTVRNENARVDYILIQTSRRNVQIKALPGGETRVYAPAWMRLRDIDAIVSKKIDAIVRMHKALDRAVNADHAAHPVGEGSLLPHAERSRMSASTVGRTFFAIPNSSIVLMQL